MSARYVRIEEIRGMTWDVTDVPPQKPENDGCTVTYTPDGNGKIHEVRMGLSREDMERANAASEARCVPRFGAGSGAADSWEASPRGSQMREHFKKLIADGKGGDTLVGSRGTLYIDQASAPTHRRYLPTLAELVDRMSIVQLKAIFIPENRAEYEQEIADIVHDIDLILSEKQQALGAEDIRAIMVIMLTNRCIWESESKARAGGPEQDHLLKFTHSVNGQRNAAKNVLSRSLGDRVDLKVDCFAADLPDEYQRWQIYETMKK